MASVIKDPNGRKRIQFMAGDGRRLTIRLGKMELRHAQAVRVKVESLLSAAVTQHPLDRQASEWLASLDDTLHEKLASAGLVKPHQARSLKAWLDSFLDSRSDLKPESKRKLRHNKPDSRPKRAAKRRPSGLVPRRNRSKNAPRPNVSKPKPRRTGMLSGLNG